MESNLELTNDSKAFYHCAKNVANFLAVFWCLNNIGRVMITIEKRWKENNGDSLLCVFFLKHLLPFQL